MENWYREMDRLQGNYDTLFDQAWNEYILGYNSARSEYDTDRSEEFSKWQMEQQNAKSEQKDAYNRISNLISASGYKPTDSELKAAGMTRAEADALLNGYNTSKDGDKKNTMPLADQLQYEKAAKAAIEGSGIDGLYDIGAKMEREGYSDSFITSWIEEQIQKYFPDLEKEQPPKKATSPGGGRSGLGTVYNAIM
jgi:hypothetical protein